MLGQRHRGEYSYGRRVFIFHLAITPEMTFASNVVDSFWNHVQLLGCALPPDQRSTLLPRRSGPIRRKRRFRCQCLVNSQVSRPSSFRQTLRDIILLRLLDDGLQNELLTPYCSFTDHTLPVTDIICGIGSFPSCRVLTTSVDHTVKVS